MGTRSDEEVVAVLTRDAARPLRQATAVPGEAATDPRRAAVHLSTEADAQRLLVLLHAFQTVTDAALAHASLDEVLHRLLEQVRAALGGDCAMVLLPDADEGEHAPTLVLRAAVGLDAQTAQSWQVPVGRGLAGQIAQTRAPVIVDEVPSAPVEVVQPYLRAQVRSLVGVPVLAGPRLVGVLQVGTAAPRSFTPEDVLLLQFVADRLARTIDHARRDAAERTARRQAEAARQQAEEAQRQAEEAQRQAEEAQRQAEVARRQAEDAQRQAEEARHQAEDAVRLRDHVLALTTHDLRSPLTAITGHADLIQQRVEQGRPLEPAWVQRHVTALDRAATRMARTIDDLLDVARLQGGDTLPLDCMTLDLGALVREAVTEQRDRTGTPRIRVAAAPTALMVWGDPVRLARVLHNVIGNALTYSPAQTPVAVSLCQEADTALLVVRDQGVGIPPDELAHIGTRFFRASTATAAGIVGTGLGLAGSRAIVVQHGGTLTLESAVGVGTTVSVRLPLAPPGSGATGVHVPG